MASAVLREVARLMKEHGIGTLLHATDAKGETSMTGAVGCPDVLTLTSLMAELVSLMGRQTVRVLSPSIAKGWKMTPLQHEHTVVFAGAGWQICSKAKSGPLASISSSFALISPSGEVDPEHKTDMVVVPEGGLYGLDRKSVV